jgi:5-methyltetrahydrofolate--homocysteine methyltransferase
MGRDRGGLKCVQGKGIVNSISLKEGEAEFLRQARWCAVTAQPSSSWRSTRRGRRIRSSARRRSLRRCYDLLLDRVGFPPEDLIFDLNVFAIATGIDEHNNYAVDFINATRWIREHLPHAKVSGGISNVSFSFRGNERARGHPHGVPVPRHPRRP